MVADQWSTLLALWLLPSVWVSTEPEHEACEYPIRVVRQYLFINLHCQLTYRRVSFALSLLHAITYIDSLAHRNLSHRRNKCSTRTHTTLTPHASKTPNSYASRRVHHHHHHHRIHLAHSFAHRSICVQWNHNFTKPLRLKHTINISPIHKMINIQWMKSTHACIYQ